MASAYSQPRNYGEYIAPINIDLVGQALMYKQQKYEAGYAQLQQQLSSVSNLDLKPADREHLQNNLQQVMTAINEAGALDFGSVSVSSALGKAIQDAVDDKVVIGHAGMKQYRQEQEYIAKLREKDIDKYSALNHNDQLEKFNAWYDAPAGTAYTGSPYTPYVDLNKEITEALVKNKDFIIREYEYQTPMYDKDGNPTYYMETRSGKIIDETRFGMIVDGIISQHQDQVRINAKYSVSPTYGAEQRAAELSENVAQYRKLEAEYSNLLKNETDEEKKKQYEQILDATRNRIELTNKKAAEYTGNITAATSPEQKAALDQLAREEYYKEGFISRVVSSYGGNLKEVRKFGKDDVALSHRDYRQRVAEAEYRAKNDEVNRIHDINLERLKKGLAPVTTTDYSAGVGGVGAGGSTKYTELPTSVTQVPAVDSDSEERASHIDLRKAYDTVTTSRDVFDKYYKILVDKEVIDEIPDAGIGDKILAVEYAILSPNGLNLSEEEESELLQAAREYHIANKVQSTYTTKLAEHFEEQADGFIRANAKNIEKGINWKSNDYRYVAIVRDKDRIPVFINEGKKMYEPVGITGEFEKGQTSRIVIDDEKSRKLSVLGAMFASNTTTTGKVGILNAMLKTIGVSSTYYLSDIGDIEAKRDKTKYVHEFIDNQLGAGSKELFRKYIDGQFGSTVSGGNYAMSKARSSYNIPDETLKEYREGLAAYQPEAAMQMRFNISTDRLKNGGSAADRDLYDALISHPDLIHKGYDITKVPSFDLYMREDGVFEAHFPAILNNQRAIVREGILATYTPGIEGFRAISDFFKIDKAAFTQGLNVTEEMTKSPDDWKIETSFYVPKEKQQDDDPYAPEPITAQSLREALGVEYATREGNYNERILKGGQEIAERAVYEGTTNYIGTLLNAFDNNLRVRVVSSPHKSSSTKALGWKTVYYMNDKPVLTEYSSSSMLPDAERELMLQSPSATTRTQAVAKIIHSYRQKHSTLEDTLQHLGSDVFGK